jgi:DNA-binding response OmpR family regulator
MVETGTTISQQRINIFSLPQQRMNARILIVDDEADIRAALTRILHLEGYVAEEAHSGNEALALLAHHRYDLMILDIRMPGLNGVQVMEYVCDHYPDLLTIVLTGEATLESAIVATKSESVINYLLKPVRTQEFVEAVDQALQKQVERVHRQNLVNAAAQVLNIVQPPKASPETVSTPPASPPTSPKRQTERFIQIYPITLDCKKRRMSLMDESPARMIELTKGETAIMATLMTHPNQTLSCYELVTLALGYDIDESEAESVIRPYIFRLRRKLEPHPRKPCLICTVRRRGYYFNPPVC